MFNPRLPDRYGQLVEVGRGGSATVYLAQDQESGKHVAVKVLHTQSLMNPTSLKRFEREAMLMKSLNHTNCVRLFDFSIDPKGITYLVMEYIYGWSARDLMTLNEGTRHNVAPAIIYFLTQALQGLHQKEIIHRDLKPQNVLISSEGVIKLSDFGIAKATEGMETLTRTGLFIGTPLYASPEQVTGDKDIDTRSDIYSLGCLLYELVAGQPPFEVTRIDQLMDAIAHGDYKPLDKACPKVDPLLLKLQQQMMALDREKRPQSVSDLASLLQENAIQTSIDLNIKPDQFYHHKMRKQLLSFGPPTTPEPIAFLARHTQASQGIQTRQKPHENEPRAVITGTHVSGQRKLNVRAKQPTKEMTQMFELLQHTRGQKKQPVKIGSYVAGAVGVLVLMIVGNIISLLADPKHTTYNASEPTPSSVQAPRLDTTATLVPEPALQPTPAPQAPASVTATPSENTAPNEIAIPAVPKEPALVALNTPPPNSVERSPSALSPPTKFAMITLQTDLPVGLKINGEKVEGVRNSFEKIPVGSSHVQYEIELPNQRDTVKGTAELREGLDNKIILNLKRDHLGELRAQIPEGGVLSVDGFAFPTHDGNFSMFLTAGEHFVKLSLPGKDAVGKKISIQPGVPLQLTFD